MKLLKNGNSVRILAVALFFAGLTAFAEAGSSLLEQGVGARAAALGFAYSALADDATALHWNPAGLSAVQRREWSGSHAELAAGTKHEFLGYAQSIGHFGFGAGAEYLHHSALEGRSADRSPTGDFKAQDMLLTLGGSRKMNEAFRLGASVKVLRSEIADARATGFAADLGSQWIAPGGRIRLAGGAQNLGPRVKYQDADENLPSNLYAGAAYQAGPLLFAADFRQGIYRADSSFNLGAEFSAARFMALRGGYLFQPGSRNLGTSQGSSQSSRLENLSGLGLGLGFKIKSAQLDYAFSPAGELGSVHRISVSARY